MLGRREAKRLVPEVPYIVVSIANADGMHPVLAVSPNRRGLLQVGFDDVVPTRQEYYGSKRPMEADHAQEIRAFVEAHLDDVELIVVHCDAGMCRSPAIAAALWRWLENERGPFFEAFRPNEHVYRTMRHALE